MNYYLDVDGTIITKHHQEANSLHSFLDHLFKSGNVFWLTTHCRYNDPSRVLSTLKPILSPKNYDLIDRIKPTNWQTLKTEAIDFAQPFLWFDDYLLEVEKRELVENNCFESWIEINLVRNDSDIIKAVKSYDPSLFRSL